jgi:hypothetical protein
VGLETLEAFYNATMDALQDAKNDVSLRISLFRIARNAYTALRAATIREM